jgi:phosphoribosylamine--glycine ligase
MRILILDAQANALDWALRCIEAGHQVKWYVPDRPRTNPVGKGLVPKVPEWQPWVLWADMVFVSDNTRYLRELEVIRRQPGHPAIIAATEETADWELNRDRGMALFRSHGIDVSPSKNFTDYDQAIAYVKKQDRAFVSKPSGDADKALSYVGKTPEDLIYMLQRWKKLGKLKAPFILQEKIEGIEMAVGGWFGPAGFMLGWCENFEFKKLCDGDRGPNTGEQGTILRYVAKSKLADRVLKPFYPDLARAGYVGYIDVNCIVDQLGVPWPLEFTMRPGWPTFNIQQALHEGDPAEWLLNLAQGVGKQSPAVLEKLACGVVLSIPDYPFNKLPIQDVSGIPIYGLKPSVLPHVHPCEMALGKAPQRIGESIIDAPIWVTAGTYILVASGTGQTVEEARRHAYQVLDRISLPNSPMYRTDIGRRLSWQLSDLQANGYASGMTYRATS